MVDTAHDGGWSLIAKWGLGTALAMVAGCGIHLGKPYNATSVAQLAVGKTTAAHARNVLGAPFKARPLRLGDEEVTRVKPKCPNAAESWTYQYVSSKNACNDTLEFDDTGVLCNLITTPSHGPRCSGED